MLPRRDQGQGSRPVLLQEMQHAPGPAPAGATLGVTADRPLVIQKVNRLLENRFREPQLGMSITEVMHQSRWVAVVIE